MVREPIINSAPKIESAATSNISQIGINRVFIICHSPEDKFLAVAHLKLPAPSSHYASIANSDSKQRSSMARTRRQLDRPRSLTQHAVSAEYNTPMTNL